MAPADGMANSEYPDQTAPLGAVLSGSALFAQTCLSQYLLDDFINSFESLLVADKVLYLFDHETGFSPL